MDIPRRGLGHLAFLVGVICWLISFGMSGWKWEFGLAETMAEQTFNSIACMLFGLGFGLRA